MTNVVEFRQANAMYHLEACFLFFIMYTQVISVWALNEYVVLTMNGTLLACNKKGKISLLWELFMPLNQKMGQT